ncbi:hypothetical protein EVA_13788, partial [gut metagenome]
GPPSVLSASASYAGSFSANFWTTSKGKPLISEISSKE